MKWIDDLRQKARAKWFEWHNIQMGNPLFGERETNVALYTGMIRMADAILLNARLYDLTELNRLKESIEFRMYLGKRLGPFQRHLHFLRRNELDVFFEFLQLREKTLPKYKPFILEEKKESKPIPPVKEKIIKGPNPSK